MSLIVNLGKSSRHTDGKKINDPFIIVIHTHLKAQCGQR